MKSCEMRHGPYHVYRLGVRIVEGQYDHGREVGHWIFRDDEGRITKEEDHGPVGADAGPSLQ